MRYTGGRVVRYKKRVSTLIAGVVLLLVGAYGLLITLAPTLPVIKQEPFTQEAVDSISVGQQTIIIPKIGVNIAYNSGTDEVLESGAWWRYPERGNPVDGGNFILSAHRFSLGPTPAQTRTKSPFYHIDKLNVGDEIIVDYMGKRYNYEVNKKYQVKPTQVEIEAKTEESKLTLYSCTLKGAHDGRDVIEAILVM
jgi:sortase A